MVYIYIAEETVASTLVICSSPVTFCWLMFIRPMISICHIYWAWVQVDLQYFGAPHCGWCLRAKREKKTHNWWIGWGTPWERKYTYVACKTLNKLTKETDGFSSWRLQLISQLCHDSWKHWTCTALSVTKQRIPKHWYREVAWQPSFKFINLRIYDSTVLIGYSLCANSSLCHNPYMEATGIYAPCMEYLPTFPPKKHLGNRWCLTKYTGMFLYHSITMSLAT